MKMGPEPDPAVDSGTFTLYVIAFSPAGVKVWTWPSAWLNTASHQHRQYTISIVSEYWTKPVDTVDYPRGHSTAI
jgi:hypothetical protein